MATSTTRYWVIASLLVAFVAAIAVGEKLNDKRASAELIWDSWGVPHIFADNYEILSYAYGYAQARDHGATIMRFVGEARGRAAEYWGESYRLLDIRTWSNRLPWYVEEFYHLQDPETVSNCEAFSRGFNQYIADHPDEYADSQWSKVLPLTGQDVLGHGLRVYFEFSYAGAAGVDFSSKEGNDKDTFKEKYEGKNGRHYSAYADWNMIRDQIPEEFREAFGSNAWAINAPKTDGSAMLDMNPHLPYLGFFRWYEGHFVVESEDLNLYGTGFVGLPNLQIAFNDHIGWTHTVNTVKPYTSYELTLADENSYYYDGRVTPLTVETADIKILQEDGSYITETVIVESSIHGVIYKRKDGYAMAARWAGLDRYDPIKQWWDMGRTRSMSEFIQAQQQLQISMFTIMAASAEGDIYHGFNGYVPVRSFGDWNYWGGAVPGNTSETLWTELHPYSELPQILNPPSGWLQNANEPPWTTTFPLYQPEMDHTRYPAYVAPTPRMGYRPQVSARLLSTNDNITFEEFIQLKHSTLKEFANHVVDDLIAAIESYAPNDRDLQTVADIWRTWDRTYDANAVGAIIFNYFEKVYPGDGQLYVNQWNENDPLGTPNTLRDPEGALEDLREAVRLVRLRGLTLDTAFGEVYKFYGSQRFPDQDPEEFPGHGSHDTFRNVWFIGEKGGALGGDSFVGLLEFPKDGSGPRARTCLGYGNATPGSRGAKVFGHVNDQFALFAEKELKPALRFRDDVLANMEERFVLSE